MAIMLIYILHSTLNTSIERRKYMLSLNKSLGSFGEELALQFLIEKGYCIIEKNFRCRLGEIDIIARNNDYITFIEVKTRYNNHFGSPCEAITFSKQKKLYKLAQVYILQKKLHNCNFRFDVVEILIQPKDNTPVINLIKDAFQINIY
jgi:putative endonuclease